jgi:hypothetical protein
MSLPLSPNRELWRLIDSVRDRSSDWFTLAEKQRMHDKIVHLKAKGTVSAADLEWLRQADEDLCGAAALAATFSCRRRKGGSR